MLESPGEEDISNQPTAPCHYGQRHDSRICKTKHQVDSTSSFLNSHNSLRHGEPASKSPQGYWSKNNSSLEWTYLRRPPLNSAHSCNADATPSNNNRWSDMKIPSSRVPGWFCMMLIPLLGSGFVVVMLLLLRIRFLCRAITQVLLSLLPIWLF